MLDQDWLAALRRQVAERYGVPQAAVRVARAPYRICPLGAHIDHQLGIVTAMAIDRAVHVAFAAWPAPEVRISSRDFPGEVRFDLSRIPDRAGGDWGDYARGAARALGKGRELRTGICGITAGRLDGGGLSSSAAISVALLLALEHANLLNVSPEENIDLALAVENDYLGLRIGVLDQAAILLSRQGQLTWLDCLSREHRRLEAVGGPPPFSILVAFSGLKQALVATDYNRRVEECASAAATLLQAAGRPAAPAILRSVSPEEYAQHRGLLRSAPARRAAHFFGEMARVQAGIEAWQSGDLVRFGQLVTESGRSSVDNYECGCPPLVDLYQALIAAPGVFGARFSGAGFRGCCVALVDPRTADEAAAAVESQYRRRQPQLAEGAYTLICASGDGASLL